MHKLSKRLCGLLQWRLGRLGLGPLETSCSLSQEHSARLIDLIDSSDASRVPTFIPRTWDRNRMPGSTCYGSIEPIRPGNTMPAVT